MLTTLGATCLMTGAKLVVVLVSRDRGADCTLIFGGTEAWVELFGDDASIAATIAPPTVPASSRLKNGFQILFMVAFPFPFSFGLARPPRLRTGFRRRSLASVSGQSRNIFRFRNLFL